MALAVAKTVAKPSANVNPECRNVNPAAARRTAEVAVAAAIAMAAVAVAAVAVAVAARSKRSALCSRATKQRAGSA